MTKICNCGTCKTANERALAFVAKQVGDGECSYFIMSVGLAVANLTAKMLHDTARAFRAEGGPEKALALLVEMEAVKNRIDKDFNNGDYWDRLCEAIDKANAAMDEERKLGKGD